jgi:hypothetical protein
MITGSLRRRTELSRMDSGHRRNSSTWRPPPSPGTSLPRPTPFSAMTGSSSTRRSKLGSRVNLLIVPREEVTLMDISPGQIVSISSALIPFLEHDDANRALMGSNMQRQSVPLLVTEEPLVGTGIEGKVAQDSGSCLLAEGDGEIMYVDADRVIVAYSGRSLCRGRRRTLLRAAKISQVQPEQLLRAEAARRRSVPRSRRA